MPLNLLIASFSKGILELYINFSMKVCVGGTRDGWDGQEQL